MLDPGCDGKLLMSKLTRDEIPQENYVNLKEFMDFIDANSNDGKAEVPQEPEDSLMEEWSNDEGGVDEELDWEREKSSDGSRLNIDKDNDDIQVRMDFGCVENNKLYNAF